MGKLGFNTPIRPSAVANHLQIFHTFSKKRLGETLVAFCFCFLSINSFAKDRFNIKLGVDIHDVIHNEVIERDIINQERGQIIATGLDARVYFGDTWYGELALKDGSADLSYKGVTATNILFSTKTEYVLSQMELLLGRHFEKLRMFGGLGYEYRERNVLANEINTGLYEEITRAYLILGSDFHILDRKRYDIYFENQWRSSVKSDLSVEYFGEYERAEVSMGEDWSWSSQFKLLTHFGDRWGFLVAAGYHYTQIAPSEQLPLVDPDTKNIVGSFYHPETEWDGFTFQLKLSYSR